MVRGFCASNIHRHGAVVLSVCVLECVSVFVLGNNN